MRTIPAAEIWARPQMLTDDTVRCDYVYSYPPRQAYGQLGAGESPDRMIRESVALDRHVNLYLHFPFCSQICAFCNLYATVQGGESFAEYVALLDSEIRMRAEALAGAQVRTVYFGGGTPSLLPSTLLASVQQSIEKHLACTVGDVPEVALEVAPDTATRDYLGQLVDIGFTRINLGVQATDASEFRSIGRRYGAAVNMSAMETAIGAGFRNVCVDLIYGLPGQSAESWSATLQAVIDHRPPTVCAYPLTVRRGTRFGKVNHAPDPAQQYAFYDQAAAQLSEAGYLQETHVRWVLPGIGGYLQKEYHWAGENLIGFGAGARSYIRSGDLRNGYSIHPRNRALTHWAASISKGEEPVTDGLLLNETELMRKSAILGLNELDDGRFASRHGQSLLEAFPAEIGLLRDAGLLSFDGMTYRLSPAGIRHRDVVVQLFFSAEVAQSVAAYDYAD